jgi:hypothetical protein
MKKYCNQLKVLALCLQFVFISVAVAAQKHPTLLEIDEKPSYTEWNTKFKVDKLEYHESFLVLHFKVVHKSQTYGTYYPPKNAQAWYLRDEKGRIYPLRGLLRINRNGEILHQYVTKVTSVPDDENVSTNVIRCELYFDRLPDDVKKVDLIEGTGFETYPNSYNAFQIKVKSFPKKPLPRA